MQRRISRICSLHSTLDTAPSGQVACRWSEQGGRGEAVDHMQVLGLAPVQPAHPCVCVCVWAGVCECVCATW